MSYEYLDSTGLQYTLGKLKTKIDTKANLASPAFTGTPTAPTPTSTDNSTKVATTAFVKNRVDAAITNIPAVRANVGTTTYDEVLEALGNGYTVIAYDEMQTFPFIGAGDAGGHGGFVFAGEVSSSGWAGYVLSDDDSWNAFQDETFSTIPTVGNGTLTIQKNGTTIDTFSANATSSKTVNITVPTNTNDLTNGAGFQTASQVSSSISTALTNYTPTANLATVATSGDYADLDNKPTIPAAQVNSDWNATSGKAQILNKPTIPAAQVNSDWNATSGKAEILNKPTLATVATSGSYNDLTNQPTIPTISYTNNGYNGDQYEGYIILGGLAIVWGRLNTSNNVDSASVAFPVAFSQVPTVVCSGQFDESQTSLWVASVKTCTATSCHFEFGHIDPRNGGSGGFQQTNKPQGVSYVAFGPVSS